jgi:hypothetical protein
MAMLLMVLAAMFLENHDKQVSERRFRSTMEAIKNPPERERERENAMHVA